MSWASKICFSIKMLRLGVLFAAAIAVGRCMGALLPHPENPVGNSSIHGYAHLDMQPIPVEIGGAGKFFHIEFDSNPAQTPGIVGFHWRIPLLSSKIAPMDGLMLSWTSPNGMEDFFTKKTGGLDRDVSRRAKSGKAEVFANASGKWIAFWNAESGDLRIEERGNPDCFFFYRNGRLARFAEKKGEEFAVDYLKNGMPSGIRSLETRIAAVSFEYYPDGLLKRMGVKGGFYLFEYLNPGGSGMPSLPGGSYKGAKLLRKIIYPDGSSEAFSYESRAPRPRKILAGAFAEKATPNVKAVRMSLVSKSGGESWIEWDADSGIVMADSGGEYGVGNSQIDKFNPDFERGKLHHHPAHSYLKYSRTGAAFPEIYFYDWESLIEMESDANTGEVYRILKVGAEGPLYGRDRKIEKLRGGIAGLGSNAWEPLHMLHYDPLGRLIREIDSAGNVLEMAYSGSEESDGTVSTMINGVKVQELAYKNGKLVYEMRKVGEDVYESVMSDDLKRTTIRKNGESVKFYEN